MRSPRHFLIGLAVVGLLAAMPAALLAQQPPPAEGDEAAMIATLESDAPLFDKAKACQQLAVIGTKKAVPVLAKLLPDEQLSHYARFGLEPIPDPAVDAALRASLEKLDGGLLIGVINSIGMRRDAGAIDDLKGLMKSSDPAVAAAAAAALGRIATREAIEILDDALEGPVPLRLAAADACLTAADVLLGEGKKDIPTAIFAGLHQADLPKHFTIAALTGLLRTRGTEALPLLVECLGSDDAALFRVALDVAQELPGKEVTQALVAELSKPLPADERPAKVLAIVKAEYGAQDKWVDVTDKLTAAVTGNGISIQAGNNLAGDPINGVVKELRVEYTLDGEQHRATVPENGTFEVEGSGAQHPRQAILLFVLGERGDRAALPVVLDAAKSGPWDVRVAATRALGGLGDAAAVPVLLETAVQGQGELGAAAADSLAQLPGDEVDAALTTALQDAEGQRLLVVIDLVGRRGIASAVPTLLKLADGDDEALRSVAVGALGLTVGLDELPVLIDRLLGSKTPETGAAAKEALRKACMRMPDRDAAAALLIGRMRSAPTATKADLLDLLGVMGGAKALEGVAAAARNADEEVQDAATRVLGEWMSADAAPVLMALAKSGNERFRIRCLRGYIRIPRQLDVAPDERIAMCREAMAAAGRDDEKKLVLEVLARYPSSQSLALAVASLDSPTLKEAAAETAVAIGEKIVRNEPAPVAQAMQQVLDAGPNDELAKRAKRLLNRAKR
jgi:HEAT repeat protein